MVFVATENNSVYALDHGTGAIAWKTHLGDPVPRSQLQCGDIDPTGITGTPVIDPATRTIYVVAFEMPGRHFLVALNTGNGSVNFTIPADPAGADPKVEQQRAALTLGNGRVYVPYGGLYGDCGAYHGWVVGANADGSGSLISYQVPTGREGGIWGPSGAVMDVSGDLFVSTGNSASSSTFDYGNAVIELSPTLQQLAYFAPTNWVDLNSGDTDLGSSGPALLGQGLIFQIGKEGVGYLLNESNLGGIGGQIYSAQVCSAVFGGDAAVGSTVFVPCSDGLVSLRVSPSTFNQAWAGPNFPAGPPVVTGNVVWTVDVSSGNLYGLDATSGSKIFSFSTASVTHFTTPAVGPGFIYVAAGSQLFAFQIG
jgi:outer membrane protein assembly factor BamB